MSAAPASITQVSPPMERLPEVSRLAALLARNVLDAQITGQPVPDGQIRSLLDAALLLEEYGVALPSLLGQIMHSAAEPALPAAEPARAAGDEEHDAGRLAWLLRPFQGSKT